MYIYTHMYVCIDRERDDAYIHTYTYIYIYIYLPDGRGAAARGVGEDDARVDALQEQPGAEAPQHEHHVGPAVQALPET